MRKVLVDRKALEEAAELLEMHSSSSGSAEWFAAGELRDILAQPAEAEGVDFGFDDRSVKVSQEAYSIFLEREQHHLAALSAVTAERDRLQEEMAELWKRIDKFQSQSHGITALAENERLRAEAEALRVALLGIASVNPAERGIDWAKAYASDGLSGTGSELYIRWLETFKEAEAVRKDAERYRWLREMHQSPCGLTLTIARVGMMELTGWSGDDPDSVIDAAMAAKEA
jgi:hypothetical protein